MQDTRRTPAVDRLVSDPEAASPRGPYPALPGRAWRVLSSPALAAMLVWALLLPACGGTDETAPSPDTGLPEPDEVLRIPGLRDPVHVLIDSFGIPHIYGSREEDVLAAQGYMHARDRFTQMDLMRHVASGRVAEITGQMPGIGPTLLGPLTALTVDWLIRSLFTTPEGNRVADEVIASSSPEVRRVLTSFCAGVNAYINDLREGRNGARLAPYYRQLFGVSEDRVPEFTPQDIVNLGLFMALFLSGMDDLFNDLVFASYFRFVDRDILADTLRSAPSDPATVLPSPWKVSASHQPRQSESPLLEPLRGIPRAPVPPEARTRLDAGPGPDPLPRVSEASAGKARTAVYAGPGQIPEETLETALDLMRAVGGLLGNPDFRYEFGSNNWAVAPGATRRGFALLANDQHLAQLNPAIYYQSHLDTTRLGSGGVNVIGVSFAGFPGITSGHTEFVAWGQTVMGYDQADVFVETVSREEDGFPAEVLYDGEAVPTRRIYETFRIGFGPEAQELTLPIVYTPRHGPIMPYSTRQGTALSLKWVGQLGFRDSEGIYRIDRVRDAFEFGEALREFEAAAFHWVFADIFGNIGYSGHARIPVRRNARLHPPFLPLPGTGGAEWEGFVSEENLPLAFNPPTGYYNTSNNDHFGTTLDNDPVNDPAYYFFACDPGFRAGRVEELLRGRISRGGVGFEDIQEQQGDTLSRPAARLLPFLFAAADRLPERVSPAMERALNRLRAWDLTAPTGVAADFRARPPDRLEERNSVGASLFYAWMNRLLRDTFADDFHAFRQQPAPDPDMLIRALLLILEHPEQAKTGTRLFDDRTTPDQVEGPDEMLLRSLDRAVRFLREAFGTPDQASWLWGGLHLTSFLLGYDTLSLPQFPVQGPFPRSGGNFTVDASDFGGDPEAFLTTFGPNTRFVIELEPGVLRAVNAQPGGQAESPEDPHYADLTTLWLDHRYQELYFRFGEVLEHTEKTLLFTP